MNKLAIVIPFYKASFFEETLQSIANQTNKDFILYIGDDASPDSITNLLKKYEINISIVYKRFDNNLGKTSLIKHWTRCIELTNHEKWLWLFGDDDVMPSDAVDRFYENLQKYPNEDLFRFNLQIVDANGKIIHSATTNPDRETCLSFINRRLNFQLNTTVVEYIFSRKAFNDNNGFVDFPLGWFSDDVTWLNLAKEKGILSIHGLPVSWRYSGKNISSLNIDYQQKVDALLLYLKYVSKHYPNIDYNLKFNFFLKQIKQYPQEANIRLIFWAKSIYRGVFPISFLFKKKLNL